MLIAVVIAAAPTGRRGSCFRRLGAERFRDDGGDLLDRIRTVKSEAELACLRESARMTSLAIKAATRVIAPGMLDSDVAAEGSRALLAPFVRPFLLFCRLPPFNLACV